MRKRNNVISFFGVLLMIVNMCSVITHNKSYSKETAKIILYINPILKLFYLKQIMIK